MTVACPSLASAKKKTRPRGTVSILQPSDTVPQRLSLSWLASCLCVPVQSAVTFGHVARAVQSNPAPQLSPKGVKGGGPRAGGNDAEPGELLRYQAVERYTPAPRRCTMNGPEPYPGLGSFRLAQPPHHTPAPLYGVRSMFDFEKLLWAAMVVTLLGPGVFILIVAAMAYWDVTFG